MSTHARDVREEAGGLYSLHHLKIGGEIVVILHQGQGGIVNIFNDRPGSVGIIIKLYDYRFEGDRSNILRGKGRSLLSRLDLLLPEIAIPIRLYEYRANETGQFHKPSSRETTLAGLLRRLKDGKNLEDDFPIRIPFKTQGEKLFANIFAFDTGKAASYRKREGIIFLRNGQSQGSLPKDFFHREAVKMKSLKEDILVFVECDELSNRTREDLFMTSRDRLKDGPFRRELVSSLEKIVRECKELRDLRSKRQEERLQDQLEDNKPLVDVLQSLIKSSPTLNKVLNLGERLSAPFNTMPTAGIKELTFKGEFYPSFFKNKGTEFGTTLWSCSINNRMRLTFETDAQNDYFSRSHRKWGV